MSNASLEFRSGAAGLFFVRSGREARFRELLCLLYAPSQLVRKGSDGALLRCASKSNYVMTVMGSPKHGFAYRRLC